MIAGCYIQDSTLSARQPRRALYHFIQTTASEGLAQSPYVATRVEFEPATLRNEGTLHHH